MVDLRFYHPINAPDSDTRASFLEETHQIRRGSSWLPPGQIFIEAVVSGEVGVWYHTPADSRSAPSPTQS
ncbi:hypothetical protein PISMIDRAFT_203810 [Pisolithus microcarpus 441]|uniref:Uncharacterized protein n=1 Tax=Pisolithus microcarpus 441 TaxID=765257 RepID=A0A0C9ZYF3_9AGAM|nr:hypothetical protein PISMIDRAFT_203810 [Pisolithus microcarpus 441]